MNHSKQFRSLVMHKYIVSIGRTYTHTLCTALSVWFANICASFQLFAIAIWNTVEETEKNLHDQSALLADCMLLTCKKVLPSSRNKRNGTSKSIELRNSVHPLVVRYCAPDTAHIGALIPATHEKKKKPNPTWIFDDGNCKANREEEEKNHTFLSTENRYE